MALKPLSELLKHSAVTRQLGLVSVAAGQARPLIEAGKAEPELTFMARLLTLSTLPRNNPGDSVLYERRNGPYTLTLAATRVGELPYGVLPRLLLTWVCREAVRTQSPVLTLGPSLSAFMSELGLDPRGGGPRTDRARITKQMRRLFGSAIRLTYEGPGVERSVGSFVAQRTELWWDPHEGGPLWRSKIELGAPFFEEIIQRPVPLDMQVLKGLTRSALGIDLYMWLTYVTFSRQEPLRLSWRQVYEQFADPVREGPPRKAVENLRLKVKRELAKIRLGWPEVDYRILVGRRGKAGALLVNPCKPRIGPLDGPDPAQGKLPLE